MISPFSQDLLRKIQILRRATGADGTRRRRPGIHLQFATAQYNKRPPRKPSVFARETCQRRPRLPCLAGILCCWKQAAGTKFELETLRLRRRGREALVSAIGRQRQAPLP